MKVKIGSRWYSSEHEPICIQVTSKERDQIASLNPTRTPSMKYASFPEELAITVEEKLEWMTKEEEDED